MNNPEKSIPPNFTKNREGKATKVTLTPETYIKLLVKANVTNPSFWPPGLEEGAENLARLRQIESDYRSKEGGFDWESLPAEIQDEYDVLCVSMDSYHGPMEKAAWEVFQVQHKHGRS